MFYLRYIIPLIGRIFLGNPDNYRMLGIYTERFNNCSGMADALKHAGLEVEYRSFFFGCASGLRGRKL
jgi:demethylmenaquinone methyltransferase/2-methoxy-6-polyprenyl-1,4-benzoquinol methylase